jgi:phospholipid/cholesterol/gamma-HCH transport system substrate-binding protein
MANKTINNIKLGVFVISGMLFLILLLYMIGRNRNLFRPSYILRVHMSNAQGLVTGNNVRYAGIESGTVKRIHFLNDTLIEVSLMIDAKMKSIIRKDATVSVGTEGLVGNKVVNIMPSGKPSANAAEGDILQARRMASTEEMLDVLQITNRDVSIIAAELKSTIKRLNSSRGVWQLLDDETLPMHVRATARNIENASLRLNKLVTELNALSSYLNDGKGTMGMLLKDSSAAIELNNALLQIRSAASKADTLVVNINQLANGLNQDLNQGNGTMKLLLKDSVVAQKLRASMNNIEKGTDAFTVNMEALRHNIFFRGYFRKQDKKSKKLKTHQGILTNN